MDGGEGSPADVPQDDIASSKLGEKTMAWNKPVVTEICMAMEINGYMPVEF